MDDRRMAQQTPRTGPKPPIKNGEIYRDVLDGFDVVVQSGWSVLAVGPPQPAAAKSERLRYRKLPEPDGQVLGPSLLRWPCGRLTGRVLSTGGWS